MKKIKSIGILLLACVMLSSNFCFVNATGVMPIYDHCEICTLTFDIGDDIGHVIIDYGADPTSFTQMKASVKIQKKFLGIFWTTVDIGEPDNTLVIYSNLVSDIVHETFPITEAGTYRAVFDIEFYGTNDVVDEINHKIEFTYTLT